MSAIGELIQIAPSSRLLELEGVIRRGLQTFVDVGQALLEIRDGRLYREQGFDRFEDYCRERWGWGRNFANKQIRAAQVVQDLGTDVPKPQSEAQARELAPLTPDERREVAKTIDFSQATTPEIRQAVADYRAERKQPRKPVIVTLSAWRKMDARERDEAFEVRRADATFNRQDNDSIEWARWSWNPVTGCLHNCPYCYARDLAERFYEQKFEPTLVAEILNAPGTTPVPKQAETDLGYRNVFVCSMADLFGKWVPARWIEAVLGQVAANPQWNFLFLTKFPQRMAEFEYPDNAWLGTSIDFQARVRNAERAMSKVKAAVKWLSIEPLLEPVEIDWSLFDWIVLGGASRSSQTPEWRPPARWVCAITAAATSQGCAVYHKANLYGDRLRDYPGMTSADASPGAEFRYLKERQ